MFEFFRQNCVSCFVISSDFLISFCHKSALLLRSHSDFVDTLLNISHSNCWSIISSRKNCRFIEHIFNVCTSKANCDFCKCVEVYIIIDWFAFCMNFENSFSSLHIWDIDINLSIKSAWTHKCWIENVASVCCRQNNDSFVGFKPIHFNKKLVESLFSFIISATKTCASLTPYCINFINEYDARFVFLCLIKKISYS